tara:strand:+ start:1064 stop:1384 length:321 start_codon:yes stop_codon:yes gene_type:complete
MKKKTRYENKEHLLFVSTFPCMVCGAYPVQVHHLLKPRDGKRGWGLKAGDNNVVPLCQKHHAELHTKIGNEFKFFKMHCDKEEAGMEYAEELYERFQNNSDSDLPF